MFICDIFEERNFIVVYFLNSESDLKILTVLKAQLPVRMTGLRWKIIVVSINLMAQFVPMECLNITAAEGKLSVHKILYGRGG
jgi:hypothetical protein